MKIRRATVSDAAEFVRLKEMIITGYYPFDPEPGVLPQWRIRAAEAFTDLVDRVDHIQFVVESGRPGRLAGCVSARLERGIPGPEWPGIHGYVADMAVEDGSRGSGWGRRLLEQAVSWCVDEGAGSIRLTATPSAVGFYAAAGFEPVGRGGELFTDMRWFPPR